MWVEEQPAPPEKAVVDRIVDGHTAVLLVGEDEREMLVSVDDLPDGAREGAWLRVMGDPPRLELDLEETARVRERIAGKLELLRRRGRSPLTDGATWGEE